MTDMSIALASLRYEDAAQIAGIDPEILRPPEGSEPGAWLSTVLEHLAKRRTHDTEITRKLESGDELGALRLAARAAEWKVQISSTTEGELAGRWATICVRFERDVEETKARFVSMRTDAPDTVELARIYTEDLAVLGPLGQRPSTTAAMDSVIAQLATLAELRGHAVALEAAAEHEALERLAKIRAAAARAFDRLVGDVLGPAPPASALRLFEALPSLIVERRFEALDTIATGALDDAALKIASAGLTLRSFRAARTVSPPPPVASPRPAEKDLSTTSRAQLANIPPAERGLASIEEARAFEGVATRFPDERASNGWLCLVSPTVDPGLRALALGRGLLALGRYHLTERRNPRIATMYLNDALACLLDAGALKSPFEVTGAVVPLLVAKASERLPADVTGSASRLQEWIEKPDNLFSWIQRTAQYDVVARLWNDSKRDDRADEVLAVADEHMPGGTAPLLRACAVALLSSPQRLASDPDVIFRRIKALLAHAGPGDDLLTCLDRMSDELAGIELDVATAQSTTFIQARLSEALASIEALPKDTAAPVSEILEHLPPVVELVLKGAPHEARPRLHVVPVVGAIFPQRRSEDIRLPVRVSNLAPAAPAQDVYLQLSILADGLPKVPVRFTDGGHSEERAVGSLDGGDETEVSFFVDLPDELLQNVAEIRFRAVLRTGEMALDATTFAVPIRPSHGAGHESPYATGVAVTGDQFVGREREVQAIRDAISAEGGGRVPLVFGIRRIGKTSILKQVMQDRNIQARFSPIYISFEDWASSRTTVDFLHYVCGRVRDGIPEPQRGRLAFARAAFSEDPYAAFERFFQSIDAVRPERRILLILDELDRLLLAVRESEERQTRSPVPLRESDALQREIFGALRKVIMTSQSIRMVFAGLPAILQGRYEDRLFGLLMPVRVKPFTQQEATRILEAAGDDMTFDPTARSKIFAATGLQPYLLQLACHSLYCRMIESGRNRVTPGDVDDMIQQDLLPYEKHFTDYIKLINEADIPIFRAVARVQREAAHRRLFVSIDEIARELSRSGRPMTRAELEDFVGAHGTDERPLIARAPNARHRFRLAIGMIGDFLLQT